MSLHIVMFFTEPLNDVKSYEYVNEKEIDVREKGKDDGDRLVGGESSSTRLSQQLKFEEKTVIRIFPFMVLWNPSGFRQTICSGEILMMNFFGIRFHTECGSQFTAGEEKIKPFQNFGNKIFSCFFKENPST